MKLTLIAISVAAVLGLFGLASRHAARRRSGRFKGRPELSLDEFFRQFEESKLALLYENDSRFSKIVGRETAARREHGDHHASRGRE